MNSPELEVIDWDVQVMFRYNLVLNGCASRIPTVSGGRWNVAWWRVYIQTRKNGEGERGELREWKAMKDIETGLPRIIPA